MKTNVREGTAERQRAWQAQHSRDLAESAREIGPLPPVLNQARRDGCAEDFGAFCRTYFAHLFTRPFAPCHIDLMRQMQRIVTDGGMQALAMPRGSGKTTYCELASIWALLYGYKKFVFVIGATETAAAYTLKSIKTELETNDMLLEDFPEVCFPVRKLEGIAHRANGQTLDGVRTRIGWTENELTMPTVEGSACSGSAIRVAGLTGRIRGVKIVTANGESIRPQLVILDDIQTNESANSSLQCRKRLDIICGDVMGLAGPGVKISAFMPITVISRGDVADTLLDKQTHPEWHGIRLKMLDSMPTDMRLWDTYYDTMQTSLREHGDNRVGNAFYESHRAAMDEGAVHYWPERYNDDELSAIQSAMNLYYQSRRSFLAEYQNAPAADELETDRQITLQDCRDHVNGLNKCELPSADLTVTAAVDVQKDVLFWTVCAFDDKMTCSVLEYGTWPDQGVSSFDLASLRKTIGAKYAGATFQNGLRAALSDLTDMLCGKVYTYGRAELRVQRVLIDSAWQDSTDIVYKVCTESSHSAILMPSRGIGLTAARRPLSMYRRKPGETVMHGLVIRREEKRPVKSVLVDTNLWKSFILTRFLLQPGDYGSIGIYGTRLTLHDLFFRAMTSEYHQTLSGQYGRVREWHLRPGEKMNHWWDCLVYCYASAHMCGVCLTEWQTERPAERLSLAVLASSSQSSDADGGAPDVEISDPDAPSPVKSGKCLSLASLQRAKKR